MNPNDLLAMSSVLLAVGGGDFGESGVISVIVKVALGQDVYDFGLLGLIDKVELTMFAPATHHFSRTYGGGGGVGGMGLHQTTSKKIKDKENANILPSKTPSRLGGRGGFGGGGGMGGGSGQGKGLVPSTSIRVGLGVKSAARDGNVMRGGEMGKGKGKDGDEIGECMGE